MQLSEAIHTLLTYNMRVEPAFFLFYFLIVFFAMPSPSREFGPVSTQVLCTKETGL